MPPLNLWESGFFSFSLTFLLFGGSFAPESYRLIFICVVASSFLITSISSKMLRCDFPTTSSENANLQRVYWCVSHRSPNSSIVGTETTHWLICCWSTQQDCQLVGSMEPLALLYCWPSWANKLMMARGQKVIADIFCTNNFKVGSLDLYAVATW